MQWGNWELTFDKTLIMGVLNVTPDSFSDGGKFIDVDMAVNHAKQMVSEGADIIDVGGESTRPGSQAVSAEEELRRVKPIIARLVTEVNVPISIDTSKPEVAKACLAIGASMINDVTGLRNEEMIAVAKEFDVPVVIMHMLGEPRTMQENPEYDDVMSDVKHFLRTQLKSARRGGVKHIIVDPGVGFGKTLEHNLRILQRLKEVKELYVPVLVGTSRKSFIGKLTGDLPVEDRLEGTLASIVVAAMNGADIVRVHDVKACKRALAVVDAVKSLDK